MPPRVFNKRIHRIPPGAVYVGRPSKWGNPFGVAADLGWARDEAIAEYEDYLDNSPDLLMQLPELRGHDLVCWCAPLPCHADVLLRRANA
jgi:hypothetical protein